MAAKNAAKPRPNKNSDGKDKKPTMSYDRHVSPGKPAEPPAPPGAPAPGASNPMTHPAHPSMSSGLGTPPAGPSDAPTDQRQVQERIQFKDLPAPAQNQVMSQQGIDPFAPVKALQQGVDSTMQKGPSTGLVPNQMTGPYMPPDVASFPDDMAHLTTLMGQGFAPGATGQEHEYAQNAHSLAMAKIDDAFSKAQDPFAAPTMSQPAAPAPAAGPMTPPTAPPSAMPPGMGGAPGPSMDSSMGSPAAMPALAGPPTTPEGAIPPAVIAGLLAKHKPKRR